MIKIYASEVVDGLADKIKENNSIAYTAKVDNKAYQFDKEKIEKVLANVAGANPDQVDLYYMYSVLVSVGWNKNDDVFLDAEVWKARNTPVSKAYNYMHDDRYIVGNVTSSFVVDPDGNLIEENSDRPELYDIVIGSVIYKYWTDEKRQEIVEEIMEKSEAGDGFVSMECLFNDFDYALTKGEEKKIIARNEESSFLTKHLRAYGGNGTFDGYKLGRAVKNITFSGVGFVDKPANERSIIFNDKNPFTGAAQASVDIFEGERESMTDPKKDSEKDDGVKLVSKALESQIDGLTAKNDELVAEKTKMAETHASELKTKDEEIEALKASLESKEEELAKAKEEAEAKDKELSEAKEVIAKAEAEKTVAERVALLVEKGATAEEATEIVQAWEGSSDEQFNKIVELHAMTYKKKAEDEKDDKNKKGKKDEEVKADTEEAEAEEDADVETEEDKTTAGFSFDDDEAGEEKQKSLQSAMAKLIGVNK